MNKLYIIGILLGTLEVAFATFLTAMTYLNASWWALGLLAYFIYCMIIGATLKAIILLALTSVMLSLAYIQYGILGAVGLYVMILLLVELLAFYRQRKEAGNL